jgi:hypothetical protein
MKKEGGEVWTGFIWLSVGTSERGNDTLDYMELLGRPVYGW